MEKTPNPLRWGVRGAAYIAVHEVIPAISDSRELRIDAIASRTEDRAKATGERLGIPRWFGSYQRLLDAICFLVQTEMEGLLETGHFGRGRTSDVVGIGGDDAPVVVRSICDRGHLR